VKGKNGLVRLLELGTIYNDLHSSYADRGVNTFRDTDDKENPNTEPWHVRHYLEIGHDAIRLIVSALTTGLRSPPRNILDFPCGSGRVTRHLRAFFPDAVIGACDLYENHINFCVNNFGAIPILSKENLDELDIGAKWDLIFCGSLLTHLPPDMFVSALKFIARSMSDEGIALITLEGRHAEFIQKHKWKFVPDDLYEVAEATIEPQGYGYVDYQHSMKSLFFKQDRYGVMIARPRWTMQIVEQIYEIRVLGYIERGWDDHQDVLVIGRPGVDS
jgi:SAM-dependent methyltransferase